MTGARRRTALLAALAAVIAADLAACLGAHPGGATDEPGKDTDTDSDSVVIAPAPMSSVGMSGRVERPAGGAGGG